MPIIVAELFQSDASFCRLLPPLPVAHLNILCEFLAMIALLRIVLTNLWKWIKFIMFYFSLFQILIKAREYYPFNSNLIMYPFIILCIHTQYTIYTKTRQWKLPFAEFWRIFVKGKILRLEWNGRRWNNMKISLIFFKGYESWSKIIIRRKKWLKGKCKTLNHIIFSFNF